MFVLLSVAAMLSMLLCEKTALAHDEHWVWCFCCSCCRTVLLVHHCGATAASASAYLLLFPLLLRSLFAQHPGVFNNSVAVVVRFFSIDFCCRSCDDPSCQGIALCYCRISCCFSFAFSFTWLISSKLLFSKLPWHGLPSIPVMLQRVYFLA